MTADEELRARREQEAAAMRIVRAYKKVFGLAGARDADQTIVWEDMQSRGYLFAPVFIRDETGKLDALRAAHTDGRRAFVIEIAEVLAKPLGELQPTKPTVKR